MLRVPTPRLLPLTIAALATLLLIKLGALLLAVSHWGGGSSGPGSVPAIVPAAMAASHEGPPAAKPPTAAPEATGAGKPASPESEGGKPASARALASAEPSGAQPAVSDAERGLLVELRQRRHELDEREAALTDREAVAIAAEHRLTARVDELQTLQTRLEKLEGARKDRDEANWRGLVKLYESMKPREAAAIFNDLDLPVLLQVLDRMKEAKAAQVLGAMQPDKARDATSSLARLRTHDNTPTSGG